MQYFVVSWAPQKSSNDFLKRQSFRLAKLYWNPIAEHSIYSSLNQAPPVDQVSGEGLPETHTWTWVNIVKNIYIVPKSNCKNLVESRLEFACQACQPYRVARRVIGFLTTSLICSLDYRRYSRSPPDMGYRWPRTFPLSHPIVSAWLSRHFGLFWRDKLLLPGQCAGLDWIRTTRKTGEIEKTADCSCRKQIGWHKQATGEGPFSIFKLAKMN